MTEDGSVYEGQEGGGSSQDGGNGSASNGASPDSGRNGWIPYHRFDEVNRGLKTSRETLARYEKYGRPEDLETKLKRYDELTKDKPFTESEAERVRKELEQADPEYAEMKKAWKEEREQRKQFVLTRASDEAAKLAKTAGLNVDDPDTYEAIGEALGGIIRRNPALMERFRQGDLQVVHEAFKTFRTKFGIGAQQRRADALVQQIKTGTKPPAGPAKVAEQAGPFDARLAMQDAHEKAFAMLGPDE